MKALSIFTIAVYLTACTAAPREKLLDQMCVVEDAWGAYYAFCPMYRET